MNVKIIMAFVGGALIAGVFAVYLSRSADPKPGPSLATATSPAITEHPVAGSSGNAADVAAGMEAVRPRPLDSGRRPKSATLVTKNRSGYEPPRISSDLPAANSASDSGTVLPPFTTGGSAPAAVDASKHEAPPHSDSVVKSATRTPETVTIPTGTSISVRINTTLNSEKKLV